VLHELVHVITDPRRFDPPVPMPEAVALARGYLRRTNVTCVDATGAAMELALDLLARHRLGRKRLFDALLTATLLVNGVDTLVTCNAPDYGVFDELSLLDPRIDPL
jgi:predicted nucleic acid-binding protein